MHPARILGTTAVVVLTAPIAVVALIAHGVSSQDKPPPAPKPVVVMPPVAMTPPVATPKPIDCANPDRPLTDRDVEDCMRRARRDREQEARARQRTMDSLMSMTRQQWHRDAVAERRRCLEAGRLPDCSR
jgi:hypothetical protein